MQSRAASGPLAILSSALMLRWLAAPASAQMIWVGPDNGNWGTAANWNPQIVPNNSPPTVFYTPEVINGIVSVNAGFNIAGLENAATVVIPDGGQLSFTGPAGSTDISNNGTIRLSPDTFGSAVVFAGNADHTLNGSGTIHLTGGGTARVLGNGTSTLINNGNTIFGEGHFIEGFMSFTNSSNGKVIASGGTLLFIPRGCTNSGLISAASGGTLVINGGSGTINNANGNIIADDGGLIQLFNSVRITGGKLITSGSGLIETVPGGSSVITLTGVNNRAQFHVKGVNTDLEGTIANEGTFTIKSGAAMRAVSTATLTSGGTVFMEAGSSFVGAGGNGTLVNASGKIIGAGQLGNDTLAIVNGTDSLIRASGGTLTINPITVGGVTNAGAIEADGGTLVLSGANNGFVSNTGGRIHVKPNSLVVLRDDAVIQGGTLSSDVFGNNVLVPSGTAATLDHVSLTGTQVQVSGVLTTANDIADASGAIVAGPGAGLEIHTITSFQCRVLMKYLAVVRAGGNFRGGEGGDAHLINNGTMEGAGSFGINTLKITNNGSILANAGTIGSEQPIWINPGADGLFNNGMIEATGLGIVVFDGAGGGTFTQQGGGVTRATDAGSNVRLINGPTVSGGLLGGGAGSLSVIGTATLSDLTSDARIAQVGLSTLLINGTVTNNGTISNTNLGRLLVTGGATLNGGGNLTNNGSIIVNTGGQLDIGIIEGTGRATVQNGAVLHAHSIRQSVLRIDDGGEAHLKPFSPADADPTRVGSLSIGAAGAFFDIANRVVIHDYSGATPMPALRAQLASGYAGGAWNGPGINSSDAATHPQHATAIAAIEAADYITQTGTTTFAGQTVDATTILMRYTWYGDTDLNAKVDGADYARIDTSFNNQITQGNIGGWINGDFDFNNKIDGADYALIDAAFNSQSGTLRGLSRVPEPALSGLLALATFARRRRRNREIKK